MSRDHRLQLGFGAGCQCNHLSSQPLGSARQIGFCGELRALTAELLHQLGHPTLKGSDSGQGCSNNCNIVEKKKSEPDNETNRLGISRITCQLGDLCVLL